LYALGRVSKSRKSAGDRGASAKMEIGASKSSNFQTAIIHSFKESIASHKPSERRGDVCKLLAGRYTVRPCPPMTHPVTPMTKQDQVIY
jgi:hypothetical protein